jgi:hypothetical protein
LQHLLVVLHIVTAVVGRGTIQDNAGEIRPLVGIFEDLLRGTKARVVVLVAADVGNLANGYVRAVVEVEINKVSVNLSCTRNVSLGIDG